MEQIRWITTPDCRFCKPDKTFCRRYACIGCSKLNRRAAVKKKAVLLEEKRNISAEQRLAREEMIGSLRAQGVSYGEIAKRMGLPRSTVQSISGRVSRGGGAAQ